jgi:hypothetical protein
MHAYLYVADNPYHGVTGADGRVVLEDVPPGVYTVSVWHEMLGNVDREVSVSAGQTSTLKIELAAEAKETVAP